MEIVGIIFFVPFRLDHCLNWLKTMHVCVHRLRPRKVSLNIWNSEQIYLLLSSEWNQLEDRHLKSQKNRIQFVFISELVEHLPSM